MSLHVSELCTFSPDGSIFTACSLEGCIKFWEVLTGKQQTYTPSSHLSASCTCMSWSSVKKKGHLDKSKKRSKERESVGGAGNLVAGGTMKGDIYIYSPTECNVITQLTGGHTDKVTGVSWSTDSSALYSCSVDNNICHWDVNKSELKKKWEGGKKAGGIHSICTHPSDNKLLFTASKRIHLWDLQNLTIIAKWRGHATEVTCLRVTGKYLLSSADSDRTISAWPLDKENSKTALRSVATFVLREEVSMFDVHQCSSSKNDIVITANTKSGLLHIFKHTLNGLVDSAVEPATTLQIASSLNGETPHPLPVTGSYIVDDDSLLIAYGSLIKPVFETLLRKDVTLKKEMCLVRSDPFHSKSSPADAHVTKVVTPHTPKHMTVLTPGAGKRKKDKDSSLCMQEKLDSLIVSRKSGKQVGPTMDSLAHLLMQGLRSEDKSILQNVLLREEESLIVETVQRLPVNALQPLLNTLHNYMQRKNLQLACVRWTRVILSVHSSHLMSCPDIESLLLPIYSILQSRSNLYSSTSSLKGRLDLLVGQVTARSKAPKVTATQPLLLYKDESSESEESDVPDAEQESDLEINWEDSGDESDSSSEPTPPSDEDMQVVEDGTSSDDG